MKATELMIGDLVKCYSSNCGGHRVDFINEMDNEIGIDGEIFDLNRVKPIPLTDEILRKNGINCVEVGDNGAETPPKNRNRYEKWLIHTTFRDTYLWYDRLADYWHLQNMNEVWINDVHELQHALRMAKIDMEIVL